MDAPFDRPDPGRAHARTLPTGESLELVTEPAGANPADVVAGAVEAPWARSLGTRKRRTPSRWRLRPPPPQAFRLALRLPRTTHRRGFNLEALRARCSVNLRHGTLHDKAHLSKNHAKSGNRERAQGATTTIEGVRPAIAGRLRGQRATGGSRFSRAHRRGQDVRADRCGDLACGDAKDATSRPWARGSAEVPRARRSPATEVRSGTEAQGTRVARHSARGTAPTADVEAARLSVGEQRHVRGGSAPEEDAPGDRGRAVASADLVEGGVQELTVVGVEGKAEL
jgi:hypothetical protein